MDNGKGCETFYLLLVLIVLLVDFLVVLRPFLTVFNAFFGQKSLKKVKTIK